MARLDPMPRAETATSIKGIFEGIEHAGNIVPNSMLTMARVPHLLETYAAFSGAVFSEGAAPAELKRLVAHLASVAAGCRYCATHNALRADVLGTSEERLATVWEFESSPSFSAAERAALRVARQAAQSPNEVTDDSFAELRAHYSEEAAVELVAVLAITAFTNRWNDTIATEIEPATRTFGDSRLATPGLARNDPRS